MSKKVFSLICAVSCSLIWGSAFIAQDMGMDYNGPFTFTFGRLFLGFLTLIPFLLIYEYKKIKPLIFKTQNIYNFLLIGFLLSMGNALQQFALLYTDVANTAVFTIFYVVLVPFVSYYFFSKFIHNSVWLAIIICLFGGILLTEFDNIQVRIGDSIAVVNALFWAFHIVFISRFLKVFNFPITIACVQCLIASLFALLPALVFENVELSNMILDGKEMIYAGVLSSGIAFLLQIYGQQNLAPAPVAIIFSLEGVFASIFGWIILSQYLNEIKIVGILLILFAVIFSQLAPLYDRKKYGRI
ncbi:DMT family transporter [Pelagibacterales bacterium SAG-MED41]|nr:DMT family transporter [Pelagibacterales bacterium SAG-MED41]